MIRKVQFITIHPACIHTRSLASASVFERSATSGLILASSDALRTPVLNSWRSPSDVILTVDAFTESPVRTLIYPPMRVKKASSIIKSMEVTSVSSPTIDRNQNQRFNKIEMMTKHIPLCQNAE